MKAGFLASLGLAGVLVIPACLHQPAKPPDRARSPKPIQVSSNGVILSEGKPYRAVGVNYFDAFLRRLRNPDDTGYRQGFAELAKRGIPFARFAACGYWPVEMQQYVQDKERYFTLMDDVIRAAEENRVGLIPSLFWYSACVPDLVGEPRSQWGHHSSKVHAFLRQYTADVVSRYAGSPAIWAWEFGNEYDLAVDLPNAAKHRPPILPQLGMTASRSSEDDLRHDMIVSAFRVFGEVVRRYDRHRPITSGNSVPRPSAFHMRTELSWTPDTREQFASHLVQATPAPLDTVSIHLYPQAHRGRFGQRFTSYLELITLSQEAASRAGKALFIGEFGAADNEDGHGPDYARREQLALLNAFEWSRAPLAALWVFDFVHLASSPINVTPTNSRAYLLNALGQANRRLALAATGDHRARLRNGKLLGALLDNEINKARSGSGMNPLYHTGFPGRTSSGTILLGSTSSTSSMAQPRMLRAPCLLRDAIGASFGRTPPAPPRCSGGRTNRPGTSTARCDTPSYAGTPLTSISV